MSRTKKQHEKLRSVHIERIAAMLNRRLNPRDTPVLLKEVASAVVDIYDDLAELHRAVRGYNGDAGMIQILTRIQTHLGISDEHHLKTPNEDRFDKFVRWLGDKVAPQVVTVIVMAVLYLTFGSQK